MVRRAPVRDGVSAAPGWIETAESRLLGVLSDGEVIGWTVVRAPAPGLVLREIGGVLLVASSVVMR